MSTLEIFATIQNSQFGQFIGSQNHLVGATLQVAHITGMLLVLSSILLVSLRLLGFGVRNATLQQLTQATSGLIWTGLGLLAFSGILIFIPAATIYYPKAFFWSKFILLAIALVVYLTWYRKITNQESPNATAAKFTAFLSLALWFGVAFCGRFIGFF